MNFYPRSYMTRPSFASFEMSEADVLRQQMEEQLRRASNRKAANANLVDPTYLGDWFNDMPDNLKSDTPKIKKAAGVRSLLNKRNLLIGGGALGLAGAGLATANYLKSKYNNQEQY